MIQRTCSWARLLGVLLLASFGMTAAESTASVIERVEHRYNSARTLSVQFVEAYSVQGHHRPPESGTLTLRKQGKMRWDYREPAGKLFVSDGKSVYLYTSQGNRVEKMKLKDTEDMRAPLAFLLGRLELKKEFKEITIREAGEDTWLVASAKTDRVPYERVTMLIGPDGAIRKLDVVGRDESVLSYSFSGERLNPPVSDDVFRFTVPPGAEVVDGISLGAQEQ